MCLIISISLSFVLSDWLYSLIINQLILQAAYVIRHRLPGRMHLAPFEVPLEPLPYSATALKCLSPCRTGWRSSFFAVYVQRR